MARKGESDSQKFVSRTQNRWQIPSVILGGSKEVKKQFIRGFFDAEGEVPLSKNQSGRYKIWIRFHHSWDGNSCSVLEQLKKLLEKDFGIQCGKVTGPKKEKKIPSFDLAIYGQNVCKFVKKIGTAHPRHIKRLKVMLGEASAA